ncbi:unnamed protein product [Psylliodes chrysocephalus]|uniref:EMI domain-containing protein n=1 Tax=Psylliodes chrysocephalus TaxID=3402493 RepID=A0A9P0D1T9_9CUCU|nr:unnamed protein product [Psylliodes chrysocephala]
MKKVMGMWQIIRIFLILKINFIYGKLAGDHICLTEETFLVNVTEHYVKNATVRNYHWCYNVPPRCSFYTVKKINDIRIVEKNESRIVEACCPGFIERDDHCILSCPICKNGICENGNCNCISGYTGENCDQDCLPGEWGPNCSKFCNCHNNKCHPKTGLCIENTTTMISTTTTDTTTTYIIKETTTNFSSSTKIDGTNENIIDQVINRTTAENVIPAFSTIPTNNDFSTQENKFTKLTTITEHTENPTTKMYPSKTIETAIEDTNIFPNIEITSTTQFEKITSTEKSDMILFVSNQTTMKEVDFTTKKSDFATNTANTNFTFSKTPIATKEGLLIPVEVHYEKQKPTTYSSTMQDKNVISVTNEEYLNRQISNNFSSNEFALFGITVLIALMLVVTILSINFLRKKKRKDNIKNGKHQVSLFSASIFHSPLPDPPVTENPLYLNPIKCQNGHNITDMSSFETRIVCNVNGTSHSTLKDIREFEYDHPPSTGTFKAAAIVLNQSEVKSNSSQDYVIEPLYDEIPQKENEQNVSTSSSTYSVPPMSIYINTCGRTKF